MPAKFIRANKQSIALFSYISAVLGKVRRDTRAHPSTTVIEGAPQKVFLKVLHEHKRPGGRYSSSGPEYRGWAYEGILRETIARFFNILPLSDGQVAEEWRAVYELERDGYIMQDPSQSDQFKILTEKGKRVVEQSLNEMKLPATDIDQLITRDDLRETIHDDFTIGDYDTAIFKVFRLLEEMVRAKAKQPASEVVSNLMTKAFNPNNGILKHPDAQTSAELQAVYHLMVGAIMWFKNPQRHRTVGYGDDGQAAHILAFANHLLDMVDQC